MQQRPPKPPELPRSSHRNSSSPSAAIIADVDPRIGLFASFAMAVTISFVGGRPAMISAATGAVALVIAPLVKSQGLDYLVAAAILAGIFQIILGLSGVAKLMPFIPRSVMVGFVNFVGLNDASLLMRERLVGKLGSGD